MKKHDIWLCDLTHTQQTIASEAAPLGIGFIAAYAQKKFGKSIDLCLFKYPEVLIDKLCSGITPKVIGFSNYVWNVNLSYAIAQKAKEIFPSLVVVFGGPNYPQEADEQEKFLRKRRAIDFYIYGEGEKAFSDLLQALIENDFSADQVKCKRPVGCHYIWHDKLTKGRMLSRVDLKEVPSPYLVGLMDEFLTEKLMPLVQTCRGCPFSCLFCSEGTNYYNKIAFREVEDVSKELKYIAQKRAGNKKLFIADSNFGMYERDLDICRSIAKVQDAFDYPKYIHVAVGKNKKDRILKAAKIANGSFRLAASVQSTDPKVLKNVKRKNISLNEIVQVGKSGNLIGSNTYAEIILALPGDTKEAHFKSIKDMMDAELNYLRIFTLMMLSGSNLASSGVRENFGLMTKFRVLPRCFGSYKFGGDLINVAEIEEVCVANDTLSFDDYLECRLFCLTVEIFYNDGILSEMFSFLKQFGISTYDVVEKIHASRSNFPDNLKSLYCDFLKETREELWDNVNKLEEFAENYNILQKYINGEYGSNLVFKYKALSFGERISEIHDVAFAIAKELVWRDKSLRTRAISDFMDELKLYSLLQKENMFDVNKTYSQRFSFDVDYMVANGFNSIPFKLEKPVCLKFEHDNVQKELIKMHLDEFGDTIVGMSRIFSRIYVKKMYRKISKV